MITKPPGWPFLTALSVLACLLMYWASVPHWYTLEMFLAGLLIGGPLMLHWTIRLALAGRRTTTPSGQVPG